MSETRSAARIVRNARLKPRSTEERTVLPLRTSSFRRSKYTTYESTVMPTETMRPVTPASVSVRLKPELLRYATRAYVAPALKSKPRITTTPSSR